MSTTTDAEAFGEMLKQYKPGTGADRYARFATDILSIRRTWVLDQLSKALEEHEQVVAVGGNGVGKSLGTALLGVSALFTNPETVVQITAGNGKTVENSIWAPAKKYWRRSGLPGKKTDNDRKLLPYPNYDEEWFLQCQSPKAPGDLEGDHNNNAFVVIEEAEKPGITGEHIDAARSVTTDEDDRILVLANPPIDSTNVVAKLVGHPEWHTVLFPSWESQNVRIDRDIESGEKIGGLATTYKIKQDWDEYHDEPWPGLEKVIEISTPYVDSDGELTVYEREAVDDNPNFRDDLADRWYKRRAGIIPPDSSDTWRPFSVADVEAAERRDPGEIRITPEALGIDVARKVDETIAVGLHGQAARIKYKSQESHTTQRTDLVEKIREWPVLPIAVDAIGKGEPLADELKSRFKDVRAFGNNEKPVDDTYRDKWAEGLQLIGDWLQNGGCFEDRKLYEELKVAAHVIEFEERTLASRGKVIEATSKDVLKEQLGRSPDRLDALLMSIWARETNSTGGKSNKAVISF